MLLSVVVGLMVRQLLNGVKMYIVTGASKNIGRYLFSELKNNGEEVVGFYNSTLHGFEEDADSYYKVDITDYNAIEEWVETNRARLSHLILVNCAGISYTSFAHKAEIDKWQRVITVNLIGTFNLIRALLPIMRAEGFGRIINFSSVVAVKSTPGVSAYAASKAGLIGLTKSLSIENASKGITVNAINLGYVSIGMGVEEVPPAYQEKMKNSIPQGRFCNPEEIYNTLKYLVDTEYITGADININGGII